MRKHEETESGMVWVNDMVLVDLGDDLGAGAGIANAVLGVDSDGVRIVAPYDVWVVPAPESLEDQDVPYTKCWIK